MHFNIRVYIRLGRQLVLEVLSNVSFEFHTLTTLLAWAAQQLQCPLKCFAKHLNMLSPRTVFAYLSPANHENILQLSPFYRGAWNIPSFLSVHNHRSFSQVSMRLHYRAGHLLADLGWVDLDLESSQAGGPLL